MDDSLAATAADVIDALLTAITAVRTDRVLAKPHPTTAAGIYRQRRIRDRVFEAHADAFADPAWDILLDLHASWTARRRVSVSSACIAANVPATTGLRHVARLLEIGLVRRIPDDLDHRRHFLQLTEHGHAMMEKCLTRINDDAGT